MVADTVPDIHKRIVFGLPTSSQRAIESMDLLELPRNLTGKRVVELYSGDDGASVGRWVVAAGGACTTVDLMEIKNEPGHILGRAENVIKGMDTDSADYVLLFGPVWWNGQGLSDIDKTMEIILESMRVIKKDAGNFLGMGTGFTAEDASLILSKLEEHKGIFEGWRLEWGEPLVLKEQYNFDYSFLKIVRK